MLREVEPPCHASCPSGTEREREKDDNFRAIEDERKTPSAVEENRGGEGGGKEKSERIESSVQGRTSHRIASDHQTEEEEAEITAKRVTQRERRKGNGQKCIAEEVLPYSDNR